MPSSIRNRYKDIIETLAEDAKVGFRLHLGTPGKLKWTVKKWTLTMRESEQIEAIRKILSCGSQDWPAGYQKLFQKVAATVSRATHPKLPQKEGMLYMPIVQKSFTIIDTVNSYAHKIACEECHIPPGYANPTIFHFHIIDAIRALRMPPGEDMGPRVYGISRAQGENLAEWNGDCCAWDCSDSDFRRVLCSHRKNLPIAEEVIQDCLDRMMAAHAAYSQKTTPDDASSCPNTNSSPQSHSPKSSAEDECSQSVHSGSIPECSVPQRDIPPLESPFAKQNLKVSQPPPPIRGSNKRKRELAPPRKTKKPRTAAKVIPPLMSC